MIENNPGAPFAPFGPSAPLPPLGAEADAPPAMDTDSANSSRSKIAPLIAGAAAIALVAGGVGGAVGFVLADRSATPVAAVASATGASGIVAAPGSIAALAAAVQPAVVQLNVGGDGGEGTGSGFVISEDGYVITNHHVVAGAGEDSALEVSFMDGSTATGRLVGSDPGYDIAVVKVDRAGLATVPLGSSSNLQVGESVIAIGSPLGLQGTVTSGIVSALDRPVTAGGGTEQTSFINAIQTDAAINPGNSGGPLINAAGAVVGVNSAIATMGQFGGAGSIGLGFAIPIDTVDRIVNEIINTGASSTPIIGVELDTDYSGDGARVAIATAGGPAAAGGVQDGDVITAINGRLVPDATSLIVAIRAQAPGDQVTLTILRNGTTSDYPITLGTRSAE